MLDDNSGIPLEIRNNISNLALFVFKQTRDVFLTHNPNKILTLIEINRNIANGLSKQVAGQKTNEEAKPASGENISLDSNI
jgi:flagellar protein FlaF